ncbi:uncharacterized protein [Chlorocebus sabaeus]|uniref:uncharacterized protein n=1 Tax=Chlorocebus sabaeus TaxID=60711 RepID=UPI003BF988DE
MRWEGRTEGTSLAVDNGAGQLRTKPVHWTAAKWNPRPRVWPKASSNGSTFWHRRTTAFQQDSLGQRHRLGNGSTSALAEKIREAQSSGFALGATQKVTRDGPLCGAGPRAVSADYMSNLSPLEDSEDFRDRRDAAPGGCAGTSRARGGRPALLAAAAPTRDPATAGPLAGQQRRSSSSHRNAGRDLSHADLSTRQPRARRRSGSRCGRSASGWSRACPASRMRATATALRAGGIHVLIFCSHTAS